MGCRVCALRGAQEAYRREDGWFVTIEQDMCPDDPRQYDDLSLMVFYDRDLRGDHDRVDDILRMQCRTELGRNQIRRAGGLVYPVRCYEHGSYAFALGKAPEQWPDQQWDVRTLGAMVAHGSAIRKQYDVQRITKRIRDMACGRMEAALRQYQDYLNGSVYHYTLWDREWDYHEGCGGFYGYDHWKSGLYAAAGLPEEPERLDLAKERVAHAG